MASSSSASPVIPLLQLRAQKLHAVLVKIVWHCNNTVLTELEGEIRAFQAEKWGSKGLAHDCEIVVAKSVALLEKLKGRNPDLRDYWDPDSEEKIPEIERIRRARIREARRNPELLRRLRDVQVRASRELKPEYSG